MIKIVFLNTSILLAIIIVLSGCGEPTHTTMSTVSTQTNQPTIENTTMTTTNADIPRDIIVELDIAGDQTNSLIGIGQLEATGVKKEIAITGNIFTVRNTNVKVTMTAEFFDSSRVSLGMTQIELVLYGAIDLEYRDFSMKFTQNPSQVYSCILTVSAYEGMV